MARAKRLAVDSAEWDAAKKRMQRVCVNCQRDFGTEGPLPYPCDLHRKGESLVMTCSPKCRHDAGYPERKP